MTIFHLSDLHLANDLIPTIRGEYGLLAGHDERTWMDFRNHLLKRIEESENEYIVIITGDISQIGKVDSYNLAQKLLFENPDSDISNKFGLNIPKDKLFIVPGNHDSYDGSFVKENNLRTFTNIFLPNIDGYPFVKEYNDNNTYRIYGFDSTTKKNAISPAKKLGKGIIDSNQLKKINLLDKQNTSDKKNIIKIACMHHCPILVGKKPRTLMMDKSQNVISMLSKNDFDFILCGHLHDDYYDVLPIEGLISLLPKRRGLGRVIKKVFQETILNEYQHIVIKGKKAKYFDSIAYHYIKQQGKQLLDVKNEKEIPNLFFFREYLHSLPEYNDYKKKFSSFKKKNIAFIMAGSMCQENKELKNSYLEIKIKDRSSDIQILKHAYKSKTINIETKESVMWL